MTDARLKSLVERIERLMDERDGLGEDIRDVFTEVKSAGYVPKVLRKVIVRRRMDPSKRAEEDSWQEMYESALDGPTRKALTMAASGATARQIEAATGIDQATVARSVSLKKRRETTTPNDPKTGEVHEVLRFTGSENGDGGNAGGQPSGADAAELPNGGGAQGGEAGPRADARAGSERLTDGRGQPTEDAHSVRVAPTVEMGHPASSTDAPPDDLAIPPRLDRRHERVRG
jgi:uncharacterized protein (UPF0335 family)